MENNVKKREWIKTAAIIFLAVLLVLTFFSNTIMNASLPEVASQQVVSGTINPKLRGQGTVAANETYEVTISQTRTVGSVLCKEGQEVQAGDVLFLLEASDSDEVITAQQELSDMELSYEQSLITAGNDAATRNHDVEKARDAYNDALAAYRQLSSMDPSQLTVSIQSAKAELVQLEQKKAEADSALSGYQTEATDISTEISEAKSEISQLEAEIEGYESQLESVSDKEAEVTAARRQLQQDQVIYQDDYDLLLGWCSGNETAAAAYASNTSIMVSKFSSELAAETGSDLPEDLNDRAKEIADAFNTILQDEEAIEQAQRAVERLEGGSTSNVQSKLSTARQELKSLESSLSSLEKQLKSAQEDVADGESAVSSAQAAIDRQNNEISTLESASSAAETLDAAQTALEDLVFQQGLGSTETVSMNAAKEKIEEKKTEIEELMQQAEGQEVVAKVSGTIASINVTAGNSVGAESPLCSITVTDRGCTLAISVTQEQASKVKVGDKASLLNYWGGDVDVTLEKIASESGGGKKLIFRLDGEVTANENLTVSIGQKSANYDTLVPNSAIRTDSNGTFVLVLTVKNSPLGNRYIAKRADVTVLAADDTTSAVTGVNQGDFVITTSTTPVEAGAQVRLVEK